MTPIFESIISPSAASIKELSLSTPFTPFNTPEYVSAAVSTGAIPCIFQHRSHTGILSGCMGFIYGGFRTRNLEIQTAPYLDKPDIFWNGIRTFCKGEGIRNLIIQTYGSTDIALPDFSCESKRHSRNEFLIDLTPKDPLSLASKNHRRNIKRAKSANLTIHRTRDTNAACQHVALMGNSMQRRLNRGENVNIPTDTGFIELLLSHGAGEIFQAIDNNIVVSSILILRSPAGAYYQSAGTSPEGMTIGASMFLISAIAESLKMEGVSVLNLGGAGNDETGLRRFKEGFGTQIIPLEAASFSIPVPLLKSIKTAAHTLLNTLKNYPVLHKS